MNIDIIWPRNLWSEILLCSRLHLVPACVSFRFNHGTMNCAISPVSAINHVSCDAPRASFPSSRSQCIFSCFERERERKRDPDFFTRAVRYLADRTIKGDQCLTFAGRNHATAAGGATALADSRRRSDATHLSRTEPCYSCTFYTRRHSTGQWHPVPIPRDWLRRCRLQVRRCVLHARASLI